MHSHVDLTMMVWNRATQITISRPGNSWSSIPVTETVLLRTWTSAPAKPLLAPLAPRGPQEEAECGDMVSESHLFRVIAMGFNQLFSVRVLHGI